MQYDHAGDRRRQNDRRTAYKQRRDEDGRRARRDRSAGWREEYAAQDVPLPRTDGGRPVEADEEAESRPTRDRRRCVLPNVGGRVRDREDDDGAELLVVDTQDVRADEYTIEATGRTVAQHNPEYPGWVPVVRAVYTEDLDALSTYKSIEALRADVAEGDLRAYTFPASRLGPVPDEVAADGGEGE